MRTLLSLEGSSRLGASRNRVFVESGAGGVQGSAQEAAAGAPPTWARSALAGDEGQVRYDRRSTFRWVRVRVRVIGVR